MSRLLHPAPIVLSSANPAQFNFNDNLEGARLQRSVQNTVAFRLVVKLIKVATVPPVPEAPSPPFFTKITPIPQLRPIAGTGTKQMLLRQWRAK